MRHVGNDVSLVETCLRTVNVKWSLRPLLDRYVVSSIVTNIVLSWPDNFVFGIIKELVPMSKPSHHSRDHEEHWEHIGWESHSFIDDSTVKVHIRIEFSLDEIRIAQCDSFQLYCNFD